MNQGSQFTSIDFIKTLKDANIQISMNVKGACAHTFISAIYIAATVIFWL